MTASHGTIIPCHLYRNAPAAIDLVLAGKPVPTDQRPSIGCNIKWKA